MSAASRFRVAVQFESGVIVYVALDWIWIGLDWIGLDCVRRIYIA